MNADVLDDNEVATILDCDTKTVQEKARAGELPAVKFGRSWRFPRAALLQKLNEMALANKPTKREPHATQKAAPEKTRRRRTPPPLAILAAPTNLRP